MAETKEQAIAGVLFGTAVGDALGLPMEGMSARTVARRYGRPERYHLIGRVGFVSDDTEQTALVAQSLLRGRGADGLDEARVARAFRLSLLGWFLRLPFGIGLGTLRACLKIALGLSPSGVRTAGNGAAMRAAVLGVALADAPEVRRRLGRALAETTHTDARAVDGALFIAELAALASGRAPDADRADLARAAAGVVEEPSLRAAIDRALELAASDAPDGTVASELGHSGFVMHTVPLATWLFVVAGGDPLECIQRAIAAGGDTDTIAAIVGGLSGALCGEGAIPEELVARIQDGPFGPSHLRALADALGSGGVVDVPRYSPLYALLRNLALYPVVLAHGFRRLVPF
jgi:ADP-ribosylglycohydrolase